MGILFGQTEVSDGYVELFRVLGQHGLIGVILGVIALCGLLALAAIFVLKDTVKSSQAFSESIKELAETVSAIRAKGEVVNVKQDAQLAEHETRLDNHEVRIVTLETHEPARGRGNKKMEDK